MKTKLLNLKNAFVKQLEGYPRITETAPKYGMKKFKVNVSDPNFDRPLNQLNVKYPLQ